MKEHVLLADGSMASFREPLGEWKVVGKVAPAPGGARKLVAETGKGIIYNGENGKTKNLITKAVWGDIQAHIEFLIPPKSNSGVYFMGMYEIQIRDSWGKKQPKYSDCGGIYQRWDSNREPKGYEGRPPRVNAARKPGEWQSYDVTFKAPCFDKSGKKIANAVFVKVVHNDQVIHENEGVTGPTRASGFSEEKPLGPIIFQGDHGPVAYRNIRIVDTSSESK